VASNTTAGPAVILQARRIRRAMPWPSMHNPAPHTTISTAKHSSNFKEQAFAKGRQIAARWNSCSVNAEINIVTTSVIGQLSSCQIVLALIPKKHFVTIVTQIVEIQGIVMPD